MIYRKYFWVLIGFVFFFLIVCSLVFFFYLNESEDSEKYIEGKLFMLVDSYWQVESID